MEYEQLPKNKDGSKPKINSIFLCPVCQDLHWHVEYKGKKVKTHLGLRELPPVSWLCNRERALMEIRVGVKPVGYSDNIPAKLIPVIEEYLVYRGSVFMEIINTKESVVNALKKVEGDPNAILSIPMPDGSVKLLTPETAPAYIKEMLEGIEMRKKVLAELQSRVNEELRTHRRFKEKRRGIEYDWLRQWNTTYYAKLAMLKDNQAILLDSRKQIIPEAVVSLGDLDKRMRELRSIKNKRSLY